MRGETMEVYFADERDLVMQLSHADYCGGGGAAGDVCRLEAVSPRAALALEELNHCTVFVAEGAAANRLFAA